MVVLNLTIDGNKISCDVLAREDATDDEIRFSKRIESGLKLVISSMPGSGLVNETDGDGHDKIRNTSK